jgi:cytoskeletal protein CcmA (bactofilin family)
MTKQMFRAVCITLAVVLLTLFTSGPVLAADLRSGDRINITSGEVIDDDLYIAGSDITIDGTVNGDLVAFGNTITVNGTVNGNLLAFGQTINMNGDVSHSARLAGQTININGKVDGDLVVFGSQTNINSQAQVGRDFLFGAGNVRMDGRIGRNIRGGGGQVTISDGVGGNVDLTVDKLTVASTSTIEGNLTYRSQNEADIQSGAQIGGETTHNLPEAKKPSPMSGIGGKILGFLMAFVIGLVIILIAPRRSASAADAILNRPLASLGWGAVILFATPVAAILVCFTLIGLPLGLIVLALYAIAIYISQIFVSLFVGRWILGRFWGIERRGMMIGALALGLFIIMLLELIPFLGFWIGLTVVLFGLGSVLVSETARRRELQAG